MISYNKKYIDLHVNNKKIYEIFLYHIKYFENRRETSLDDVFEQNNPIFNEYKNLKNSLQYLGVKKFNIFKIYPCELYVLNLNIEKYYVFQIFPFYKDNIFFSKQKTDNETEISKIKTNKAIFMDNGSYFLKNDENFRLFMNFN